MRKKTAEGSYAVKALLSQTTTEEFIPIHRYSHDWKTEGCNNAKTQYTTPTRSKTLLPPLRRKSTAFDRHRQQRS